MVTVTPVPGVLQPIQAVPVEAVRAPMAVIRTVTPTTSSPGSQNQVSAQAKALTEQIQTAVVKQGSLAPLIADLELAADTPGLPAAVQNAAARVLAQAGPLGQTISGTDIAKAFAQSGLFLEARLAAEPRTSPIGRDLKAGLLVLKKALDGFLATQAQAPTARTPGPTPPPPYREGATSAQPPAMASLPPGAPAPTVAKRLVTETESALARTELLQLASLPTAPQPGSPDTQVTRWMFEIPFTSPQGATVAQFEISRDGGGGAEFDGAQVWRAGFSLDVEPLGPLHARVSLVGDQAGVNLWAERAEGEARLKAMTPMLAMGLAKANIRADVAVHAGAPPRPTPGAGQFVDQVS